MTRFAPLTFALLTACASPVPAQGQDAPAMRTEPIPAGTRIERIQWYDADSGWLIFPDGTRQRFRLADVDAGEIGGVGAAIGGSKCELERERGYEAKAFMVEETRAGDLRVTADYGPDRSTNPRRLVMISDDHRDLGKLGMDAGHLVEDEFEGTRRLSRPHDWCE